MKIQELLQEERQAKWKYTEKRTKGALQKVILELEGNDSGAATRLAKRYERLDKTAKLLKERRDTLNAAIKDIGDNVFDPEDALATRIIQTISYTMMLTAAEKAEMKQPTKKVDYESAFAALARMVPELEAKMKEVLEMYTELIPPKDTPVGLRVKPRTDEGLRDVMRSFKAKLKEVWSKVMDGIKSWGASYDQKLAALKKQYPA